MTLPAFPAFLALTFAISLGGFALIVLVPGAQSPESARGLPFWLLTVWGPSLAALILAARAGEMGALLGRAVRVSTIPPEVWLLMLVPIAMLLLLRPMATGTPSPLPLGLLLASIGFNLILGPLGEELGWRGVLQEGLQDRIGWLTAALAVGAIWFVWHLPLWLIPSPQSEIPVWLFGAHCMAYAVIIGAAYRLSGGSILPAIALHLSFNLAANWALFAGFDPARAWFEDSLWPYVGLALVCVTLVTMRTGQIGLRAPL